MVVDTVEEDHSHGNTGSHALIFGEGGEKDSHSDEGGAHDKDGKE